MPVLEPAQTPIQKLLETVADGDVPEADGGFCKEGIFFPHFSSCCLGGIYELIGMLPRYFGKWLRT